jgi:multidrug resistance protein, MATE family
VNLALGAAEAIDLDTSILVQKPYRSILRLATPTVIAMLTQSAVNEIDVVFFSHLPCPAGGICESSNGQAALLPSLIIVWLFGGSLSAISVGTQALTARRYAERNYEAAGAVLTNAVFFCLIAGIVASLLGAFVIPRLLGAMIKVPEVRDTAIAYSNWRLMGIMSMAMTQAIKAFFDGIGKTHVHLVAAVVMNVFNVFFCFSFIFGNFGAPRLGAPGAGLSAFLATWIGLFIMVFYGWGERRRYRPMQLGNLSLKLTWDLLKLSIPAAIATSVMMFGFGLFSSIVGKLDAMQTQLGSEAVNSAATTDIVEILKLTFTACIAFGTTTATLVSQSLGRKRPEDAARFGWASVRLGLVIFGVIGLSEGVLFTEPLVNFISHSAAVRQVMMNPMRLMGVVTPVIAVAMILSEALFGAGNTRFVAVAQLVLIFGVLVPAAWVLGLNLHMGLMGIWTSACVYSVLAAITMSLKFRRGDWKAIQL